MSSTSGLTEDERLERNLSELLGEMRVAMPGVQVLFAFLLAVAFQDRFGTMTTAADRWVYAVALGSAALATAAFVAPTGFHRLLFHRGERPRLVRLANRCAIAGLAFLAVALTASATLVASVLTEGTFPAVIVAVLSASLYAAMWFGLGLLVRRRGD